MAAVFIDNEFSVEIADDPRETAYVFDEEIPFK